MNGPRAFITGLGMVSAAGKGRRAHLEALETGGRLLSPLSLFSTPGDAPPLVGEVSNELGCDQLPRTHALALEAARQACADLQQPLDAVAAGVTTGGMPLSEVLLEQGEQRPGAYALHGAGTVAHELARRLGCRGLTLTISTACSSSAAALAAGLALIRSGKARRVLACGVDGLCRLTYFGFKLLQLVDPGGARPLDLDRKGLSLGEAAAAFVLSAGDGAPEKALAELRGAGLSCDAHHPTAPHPRGQGAARAMSAALNQAGVSDPARIGYINLHGTGTKDNDRSEAAALHGVFGAKLPPHSSSKGAWGHTLGAAGALEAGLCVLALNQGIIPSSPGLRQPDPELGLDPVRESRHESLNLALSNSFGFGGNNASLVLGSPDLDAPGASPEPGELEIMGWSAISGAGDTGQTWQRFASGKSCAGMLADEHLGKGLPPRMLRRLKRLPRLALSLAQAAKENCGAQPGQVFFGAGMGALSETYDFLDQLYKSGYKHSSPIDFMGSVHNAPAGQLALFLKAQGPNITTSGEDYSFEQALLSAAVLGREQDGPILLAGADQAHEVMSPLLNPGGNEPGDFSDGGGALVVRRSVNPSGPVIRHLFYQGPNRGTEAISVLIDSLGGDFGAVMAGLPQRDAELGESQLAEFAQRSGFSGPVIRYRELLGHYPTAAAAAAVMACEMIKADSVPPALAGGVEYSLAGKGILMLTLGEYVVASQVLCL